MGLPCIHRIRERLQNRESLYLGDFNRHCRLYNDQDMPPINPRDLVLEPEVVRRKGRPGGSLNRSSQVEPELEPASQDRSTQRDPSAFVLSYPRNHRAGKGEGEVEIVGVGVGVGVGVVAVVVVVVRSRVSHQG
ncbi:uncharacterized protein ATNIH1004_005127 [Aspergillus tanneri]|uniref:Uncharacterized protein n=1 Tax=Aspergillus tanneri TaxID=1220188 RepID=A0A5M9MQ48_9EURO|nr:uncharacterized protein ATNIH1004_005127 [Aspergillus tanneri]KAA8649232.1 hypothetical protein ATNIH1004_005127 [Aspergillus tanneri]